MKFPYARNLLLALLTFVCATAGADDGATPASSTALSFGLRAHASLDGLGDVDVFRIDLEGRADIRVQSGGSSDPVATLSDSAGTVIAEDDDSGSALNFRFQETLDGGVYYLTVTGKGATGKYQVLARIERAGDDHGDTIAASTRMTAGEIAGSVRPASDVDAFRIDVPLDTGARLYSLGPTDTLGELRDSNGRLVQSADGGGDRQNFHIDATLEAGVYYLLVSARSAGGYTIVADFDNDGCKLDDAAETISDPLDADGDGVIDALDAFPNDPGETTDTDRDGAGNNSDLDDDNDGAADVIDEHPLDRGASVLPGLFRPSADFAAYCADPRAGVDAEGRPFPDLPGSVAHENNWLRSWSNEEYLWYDEIVDVDPTHHDTPTYFDLMRTFAKTPSGRDKDRFHFTWDTEDYLRTSNTGVAVGYGAEWAILQARRPREIRVAFTEPNSPASRAGLTRGARVIAIDGARVVDGDAAVLNAGLFPGSRGETHTFVVRDLGASVGAERTLVLTAEEIAADPVQNDQIIQHSGRRVAYMAFHEHNRVAEGELVAAVRRFDAGGAQDLVLDLRYNGGGLLYVAAQVGYMVAGPTASSGKVFDSIQFNDKRSADNIAIPFYSVDTDNRPLPSLDLERVFVLSSARTCSASESIINGLRGIDVEVILIGATTCGKPYGFLPADNCGTTYFSTQLQSFNDKGFGDYADGFVPVVGGGTEPWEVPGCLVADDFDHVLGDRNEARLAAALGYISNGRCPPATASSLAGLVDGDIGAATRSARTILRQNRWYDGVREASERERRRQAQQAESE